MPNSADDAQFVAELADEFSQRYQRGECPSIDQYAMKYPHLSEQIRRLFPALVLLDELSPPGSGGAATAERPSTTSVPSELGDYRIIREIGRGGMGIVYEAWQRSLSRRVALKVLSRSVADQRSLDRFQLEARSAARLHHAHIVPVFDVENYGDAWYYTMRYIEGVELGEVRRSLGPMIGESRPGETELGELSSDPTTTIAAMLLQETVDMHEPSTVAGIDDKPENPEGGREETPFSRPSVHPRAVAGSARCYFRSIARIGMQAAGALGFAHGEGIVHRDIKPSNLLLDHNADVWITDFGLAKAADQQLTQTGDVVGTLGYMAPECFQGWADPRSDVYSLGITLYEMITFRPAFTARDHLKLLREISDRTPARPRQIDARIPLDLEKIVCKAIEKEPSDRYQTAGQLAEDLQRFLSDQPILARTPGHMERLIRWSRRHPVPAALSAGLLAVLVGGLATVGLLWRSAAAQRDLARLNAFHLEREQEKRDEDFHIAHELINEMYDQVFAPNRIDEGAYHSGQEQNLKLALDYLQRFIPRHRNDPRFRASMAAAYSRLGYVQSELVSHDAAVASYRLAVEIFELLIEDEPHRIDFYDGLAGTFHNLATSQAAMGALNAAVASFRSAIETRQRLAERVPESCPFDAAIHWSGLGNVQRKLGLLDASRQSYATSIDLYRAGESRGDLPSGDASQLGESHCAASEVNWDLGRKKEAWDHAHAALEIQRRVANDDSVAGLYRCRLSSTLSLIGRLHRLAGSLSESTGFTVEALELAERLVDEYPSVPRYRRRLAIEKIRLAGCLHLEGNLDEAIALSESGIEILQALTASSAVASNHHFHLGVAYAGLATSLRERKDLDAARINYLEALKHQERACATNPDHREYQVALGGVACNLGNLERRARRYADADRWFRRSVDALEPLALAEQPQSLARRYLANAHAGLAGALESVDDPASIEHWERASEMAVGGSQRSSIQLRLANALLSQHEHRRAADVLEQALEAEAVTDDVRFQAARGLLVCCSVLSKELNPDHPDFTLLRQRYADGCIEALRQIDRDYLVQRVQHFDRSPHLRGRPDFDAFIRSLRTPCR